MKKKGSSMKFLWVLIGILVLGGGVYGAYYMSAYRVRQELKFFSSGVNKNCYDNIIDYRLTDKEVRVLLKFMKELQVRPTASFLEFTDIPTVQSINLAYQVCQSKVVSDQQKQ